MYLLRHLTRVLPESIARWSAWRIWILLARKSVRGVVLLGCSLGVGDQGGLAMATVLLDEGFEALRDCKCHLLVLNVRRVVDDLMVLELLLLFIVNRVRIHHLHHDVVAANILPRFLTAIPDHLDLVLGSLGAGHEEPPPALRPRLRHIRHRRLLVLSHPLKSISSMHLQIKKVLKIQYFQL